MTKPNQSALESSNSMNQLGQCGIGQAICEQYYAEHVIDVTGKIPKSEDHSFLCFHEKTGVGQFVPRNLMVDPYGVDINEGSSYWATHVLMLADSIDNSDAIISGKLYLATCVCWVITFLCIMKGVDSASCAVTITMPLPLLLLFIMLNKCLTLDGAWKDIKAYCDFSCDYLSETGICNAAIGQCFFSLSVGTSLLSCFVVYSILGYVVYRTGNDELFTTASLGLVFSIFPVAIQEFGGSNLFGIIFYLTLVLLGIDSAFSIVEAISTVIADSDLNLYRLKWSRTKISAILCVVGALGSSLYCFDTRFEAFNTKYKLGIDSAKIGNISASIYRLGYWFGLLLAWFLGFSLATPIQENPNDKFVFKRTLGYNSWIVGFTIGIFIWFCTIIICYIKRSDFAKNNLTFLQTMWYIMGWENVEVLRDFINQNDSGDETCKNNRHTLKGEIL